MYILINFLNNKLPADKFKFSSFLSKETAKLMVKIDDLVDRVPKLHNMINSV